MKTKSLGSWLFIGFAIQILTEILAAILIASTESGAYSEGFAYIIVIVMLIIAIPVTLIGNIILIPRHVTV